MEKEMAQKTPIGSFVFLDLETTGLPYQERYQTKITELAMVAVNRDHILTSELGYLPRVLQKLVLCFFTSRVISETVSRVTGLSNHTLQYERKFDKFAVDTINGFLDRQRKPVCFVVHNGNLFDYPILRAEIDDLQMKLADDVLCIDSLSMFRQFSKKQKEKFGRLYINRLDWEALDNLEKTFSNNKEELRLNASQNEYTAQQEISLEDNTDSNDELAFDMFPEEIFFNDSQDFTNVIDENNSDKHSNSNMANNINKRSDSFSNSSIPGKSKTEESSEQPKNTLDKKNAKLSLKLGEIYQRLIGKPPVGAHHAEGDCLMLLECCMAESKRFVDYCDTNSKLFSSVPRMQPKCFKTTKTPTKSTTAIQQKLPSKVSRFQKLNNAF